MASLLYDDLMCEDDETEPEKRTWFKEGDEPDTSLADWSIILGTQKYRVHKADLGHGDHESGYFNAIFKRWTEGSTETDLSQSLRQECRHVFEEVLDFVYGVELQLSAETVVSHFHIARFLGIKKLMKCCIAFMKDNTDRHTSVPMLRKALILSPGLDPIIQSCISTLAVDFFSCATKDFLKLPMETVAAVLTNAVKTTDARRLKVCNIVTECVRDLDGNDTAQQLMFHGLESLLSDIAPEDALFLLAKAIQFDLKRVHQLCLPTVALSFHSLNSDDLAKIPDHKTVCSLLDQDNLAVMHEDMVFDVILKYCNTKGQELSSEEQVAIWETCRFVLLSTKCITKIMEVKHIPVKFVKLALIGSTIQREKGQEALESFADASDTPSCQGLGRRLRRRTGWLAALKAGVARNQDLSGCNFSGMDLSGIDFTNCNLTTAVFTDAIITGVNFDGAILTDVVGLDNDFSDTSIDGLTIPFQIQLATWLGNDKKCKLLYRGSRDGFAASQFHAKCDNKGATLTVVQTTTGNIFGGYVGKPWTSNGNWMSDASAWLYSLKSPSGHAPVQMLSKTSQHNSYHNASYGPTFGGNHDLRICNNCNTNHSYSKIGNTYHLPSGCDAHFLEGTQNFTVAEIEVYQVL